MRRKTILLLLLLVTLGAIFSSIAVGKSHLPAGMQKIIDYNNRSTADFALKISFFIAFVAGMLGILSPCLLPFLPAYFSYTFKEKKNITKMTFVFFFGFSSSFVLMGLAAGFFGQTVLTVIQTGWLVSIAGLMIVVFGIMTLMGKGFASILHEGRTFSNDVPGTFLFGIFFALGWTACLGPILAGILGIGAILGSPIQSGILLFFYSLGNMVPLFLLAVFYDRLNLGRFMKKTITVRIGKRREIPLTNLIAGGLFLLIGGVMVIFQGTALVNTWDFLGTKQYFYSVQDALMAWQGAPLFSMVVFSLFVLGFGYFFWRQRKKGKP
ncbi:MAG: cytochrome c biogenesis protein CcdA [DPANN group archaeon]|nr:cytochrome c biogenesis protein CcdA [DPANN group archaeon]